MFRGLFPQTTSLSRMILGVDPGFASCGYALLQPLKGLEEGGSRPVFIAAGVIRTTKTTKKIPLWEDNASRTQDIYAHLKRVAEMHKTLLLSIEAESWTRMPSDKLVGMARGAIYSLAFEIGAGIEQYSPKETKKEFCGSGSASKVELEKEILDLHPELLPFLTRLPKTQRAHAADAAACALISYRKSNHVRSILRAINLGFS